MGKFERVGESTEEKHERVIAMKRDVESVIESLCQVLQLNQQGMDSLRLMVQEEQSKLEKLIEWLLNVFANSLLILMNSSGDSSFNKNAAFNSCKNIAAIILILLGCGCSVTCLAFWVVKGAGKFISVPYFINSCSQSYFLLKYSNEGLGIAVFITTSIAAAFQGLLLIVYILVQLKKHNSSALVKRTI